MGDLLEEDDWVVDGEEEQEADWKVEDSDDDMQSAGDASYEDIDLDDNSNKNIQTIEKKLKKMEKFAKLKEKKRQALEAANSEEGTAAPSSSVKLSQLSLPEMFQTFLQHCPMPYKAQQGTDKTFTEDNFFYPALDPHGTTESTTKSLCPFVRALSASLPNYKKILLQEEDADHVKENGSPAVIVLCSSAFRATEIIKSISSKLIKVKIGKLFAKHFKLSEQIDMLATEYFPLVIGTPNRIDKLLEMGALSLKHTKIILTDYSTDMKHFTILNQPDVQKDIYKLFYDYFYAERKHLKLALIRDSSQHGQTPTPAAANAKKPANHVKNKFLQQRGKLDNSNRKGIQKVEDGAAAAGGGGSQKRGLDQAQGQANKKTKL